MHPRRIIIHVDMDAFYAAVEQRDRPELRGQPVIVGGTPEGRGVVAAASYEARRFGIHSAMPAARAVRLCPQGIFLSPNFAKYRAASISVMGILGRHSDRIEQISIDEAFLDLTGRAHNFAQGERIARQIKAQIRNEVRLTASVGVAPNKFLAKLASDHDKPDGLVVIRPEVVDNFLAPLPVGKLWGVGPKTATKLTAAGLGTIGMLRAAPIVELRRLLGAWADVAYELARGIDERPVETAREAKSISSERTFPQDIGSIEDMRRALASLSEEVARRLVQGAVRARTIAIKVRFADFHTITRQTTLSEPTDRTDIIRKTSYKLFDVVERRGRGIRLLGVRASGLEHGVRQKSLFDEKLQRRGRLEKTISYLQKRYGSEVVRWARESAHTN